MKRIALTTLMLLALTPVHAEDTPRRSELDPRVRYVTYKPDDVVAIPVRRGVVTRIILGADEKIVQSGTGFAANCANDALEWCVRADPGSSQIWVKARDNATHNNLEVATDRGRDYSLSFRVLPDARTPGSDEVYRVIFQYVLPPPVMPASLRSLIPSEGVASAAVPVGAMPESDNNTQANAPAAPPTTTTKPKPQPVALPASVEGRLALGPDIKNTHYTMNHAGGGDLLAPSLAFDDQRFTYLKFPANRQIPAPFVLGADGNETRANFRMQEGGLMVIEKIARAFILRLGEAVVGIYNEAFDADGVEIPTAVAAPGVLREVK